MPPPLDWKRLLRSRPVPLGFVWATALLVIGAGALAISISSPSDGSPRLLGSDFPVNAGASKPGDIQANNSPGLVRNPVKPGNVVVVNRVDRPRYSCGLHVSFDNGRDWADTPIATPRGEEDKCFAPGTTPSSTTDSAHEAPPSRERASTSLKRPVYGGPPIPPCSPS